MLERHEKSEKTAAYKAGVIIAGLLLIPILITFIVGLVGGVGLDVSAVVTASMLLVAALTVVPLVSKRAETCEVYIDRRYCNPSYILFRGSYEWTG